MPTFLSGQQIYTARKVYRSVKSTYGQSGKTFSVAGFLNVDTTSVHIKNSDMKIDYNYLVLI